MCDCKSCSALKKLKLVEFIASTRAPAIQSSVGALKERELYGRESVKRIFTLKYITLDENYLGTTPNGSNRIQISLI